MWKLIAQLSSINSPQKPANSGAAPATSRRPMNVVISLMKVNANPGSNFHAIIRAFICMTQNFVIEFQFLEPTTRNL